MSAPGSKADLKSYFRFTPQSGLRADFAPCSFRANNGSRIFSRTGTLNHIGSISPGRQVLLNHGSSGP